MAEKKKGKRKTQKRRASKTAVPEDLGKLNALLIENFVSLQKALTNLTEKFAQLSDNISKLLQLFEVSAKSFSEKLSSSIPEIERDKEFLEKLNKLLEQNKLIAKGITLMEEKIRERVYGTHHPPTPSNQPTPPTFSDERYIPSIGSKKTKPGQE